MVPATLLRGADPTKPDKKRKTAMIGNLWARAIYVDIDLMSGEDAYFQNPM